MGRKALEKGKEIRCRLHDETEKVTVQGRFLIIKLNDSFEAERISKMSIFIRPDRKKGPVKIT